MDHRRKRRTIEQRVLSGRPQGPDHDYLLILSLLLR